MVIKATNRNNFVMCCCFALFFGACNSKGVYNEYKSIPNSTWKKTDTVRFNFSVLDTISKHNLYINIRNDKNYGFSNLFLITKLNFPDGQKIVDTLEYEMADVTGKFLGEGFTEIKENKLFYKEHKGFPKKGAYSLEINQAMRRNGVIDGVSDLEGILDVGFKIEKIK